MIDSQIQHIARSLIPKNDAWICGEQHFSKRSYVSISLMEPALEVTGDHKCTILAETNKKTGDVTLTPMVIHLSVNFWGNAYATNIKTPSCSFEEFLVASIKQHLKNQMR